jgi:hypothetical protein
MTGATPPGVSNIIMCLAFSRLVWHACVRLIYFAYNVSIVWQL